MAQVTQRNIPALKSIVQCVWNITNTSSYHQNGHLMTSWSNAKPCFNFGPIWGTYVRFNSNYQYKYSAKVEECMNKQIQAEEQAAQDYLAMAVYFGHVAVSRPGCHAFFMAMHDEEMGHMKEFIRYQLMRGGTVSVGCLAQPPASPATMLEAFQRGLTMEKTITEKIENIIVEAEKVKDYQCADYLTSLHMAEQVKSINEMAHHVTKLCRLGNDEHALFQYDCHLLEKYPLPSPTAEK